MKAGFYVENAVFLLFFSVFWKQLASGRLTESGFNVKSQLDSFSLGTLDKKFVLWYFAPFET